MGVYAPDAEAYTLFAPLLDNIIQVRYFCPKLKVPKFMLPSPIGLPRRFPQNGHPPGIGFWRPGEVRGSRSRARVHRFDEVRFPGTAGEKNAIKN